MTPALTPIPLSQAIKNAPLWFRKMAAETAEPPKWTTWDPSRDSVLARSSQRLEAVAALVATVAASEEPK